MDTKNQSSAKIPAVRTYARDLENNRKAKGLPSENAVVVEKETEPTAKTPTPPVAKRIHEEKIVVSVPKPPEKAAIKATSLPPLNTIQNKHKNPARVIAVDSKNSSFIVDGNEASSATIITDTKHNRFKLLPAIFTSLSQWYEAKKLARQAKKVPKYTVPETTRRKGVIQKATSQTGKITTSDFSSIHERIKQRKENEEKPEPSTTWSANTEPGFLLLESPEEPKVSNVQLVARKSFRTPAPAVVLPPKITPAPVVVPTAPTEITQPTITAPVVYEDEVVDSTKNVEVEYEYPEEVPEQKQEAMKGRFRLLSINTNMLAMGISGLVLAVIIVTIYIYFILTENAAYIIDAPEGEIVTILDTPIKLASGEKNNKASLVNVLKTIREEATDAVQIAFVYSGSENSLIPPHVFLSIFGISLDKNFSQSLSQIRVGYTKDSSPFIVMKTSNEDSALGGLLNWEQNMPNDLADILLLGNNLGSTKFTDASLGGTDVRVLKNENGIDILIYGILNNTVIITRDSFNFIELTNLMK